MGGAACNPREVTPSRADVTTLGLTSGWSHLCGLQRNLQRDTCVSCGLWRYNHLWHLERALASGLALRRSEQQRRHSRLLARALGHRYRVETNRASRMAAELVRSTELCTNCRGNRRVSLRCLRCPQTKYPLRNSTMALRAARSTYLRTLQLWQEVAERVAQLPRAMRQTPASTRFSR